jgi:uncharacterized protein
MLVIQTSQIPNAGKGLFTTENIAKGTLYIEYLGDKYTWKQCQKRALDDKEGYVFYISERLCIDAFDTPEHLARFANDAAGLTKTKGLCNNTIFHIDKKRGYLQATRNIKEGEELFVSYGKDYWDAIRENIKNGYYDKK